MAIEQVAVRFVADIQQYAKNVQEAQKYVKNFATTNESAASKIAADLKRMAASYLGLAASVRTVQKIIKEGMDFNKFVETSTAAFGVMMKSTDAAKAKMQELYDWAVKSPLTFKETVAASKQLLAYGFSANKLVDTMQTLGTVAKATGHSLDDIAYVYGTLKTQGRAYTRDLMQFAMRGIPIYDELAKVLSRPKEEIQKLTEAGKVGFKEVEQAFKNMTTNGGVYAGFLEEYMKTLEGKTSMLTDVWQKSAGLLTAGISEQLKPAIEDLTEALGKNQDAFITWGNILGGITKGVIEAIREVSTVVGPLIKGLGDLITWIGELNINWDAVIASTGLFVTALNPLVGGVILLAEGLSYVVRMFGLLNTATVSASDKVRDYQRALAKKNIEDAKLQTEEDDEAWKKALKEFEKYKDAYEKWQASISGDIDAVIDQEHDANLKDLKEKLGAYPKLYEEARKWIDAEYEYKKMKSDQALRDEGKKYIITRQDLLQKLAEAGEFRARQGMAGQAGYEYTPEIANVSKILRSAKDQLALPGLSSDDVKMIQQDIDRLQTYYDLLITIARTKPSSAQMAALSGSKSSLVVGEREYYLEQARLDKLQSEYDIKSKMFTRSQEEVLLAENELKYKQAQSVINDNYMKKQQDFRAEMWSMLHDLSSDEIGAINDRYDAEVAAAIDKYGKDVELAKNLDAYLRLLAAKRAKDLNLATYKNVMGGSSAIWEQLQAKAGAQFGAGNWMKGYGLSALASLQGTGVGNLVEGYMGRKEGAGGGAGMGTGLNVFMTALQAAGGVLSMVVKFIADIVKQSKPMTDLLQAITTSVSGALMPVISSLAEGLSWLYDNVVVPVGNGILEMANMLIRGINKTFGKWLGFKINEFDMLKTTTEALKEMADAAISTKALTQTIDYLQEKLDTMVESQIASLQDLYEVGAISAQEYESQSKAIYKQAKEQGSLVSIADLQLTTLGGIYTRLSELLVVQQLLADESLSASDTTALLKAMNIATTANKATISQSLYDTLSSYGVNMDKYQVQATTIPNPPPVSTPPTTNTDVVSSTMTPEQIASFVAAMNESQARIKAQYGSVFPFLASGTSYVPQNMPANIHKGEMIIPSDFSSAIRRGDLTLGSGSSAGGNINVTVNVEGSVQTENKLAASIANAIYRQRRSGVLTV